MVTTFTANVPAKPKPKEGDQKTEEKAEEKPAAEQTKPRRKRSKALVLDGRRSLTAMSTDELVETLAKVTEMRTALVAEVERRRDALATVLKTGKAGA